MLLAHNAASPHLAFSCWMSCHLLSMIFWQQRRASRRTSRYLLEELCLKCLRTPNPYNLSEKYWQYTYSLYCNTRPICNAAPCWLLSLEERETPPISTAVRPQFVSQYASHLYRQYFEKIPVVGRTGKFLTIELVYCFNDLSPESTLIFVFFL